MVLGFFFTRRLTIWHQFYVPSYGCLSLAIKQLLTEIFCLIKIDQWIFNGDKGIHDTRVCMSNCAVLTIHLSSCIIHVCMAFLSKRKLGNLISFVAHTRENLFEMKTCAKEGLYERNLQVVIEKPYAQRTRLEC